MNIWDVRDEFADLLFSEQFVIDKSGVKMLEIVGSTIVIHPNDEEYEDYIFATPNREYIERELEWYKSQSLRVDDIPAPVPEIWKKVASKHGTINSNYGFLIWSPDNYSQYYNVLETLKKDPYSRRAIMIYTRPIMQYDYNRDGMSDFVCTNTVQYFIRGEKLEVVVNMRSNDAVFGFRNDYAWQLHVQKQLAEELGVAIGKMHWQTGSLHVYERHFYLVDYYELTGFANITKQEYDVWPDKRIKK